MINKKAWLYITTNLINGKKYIGQTTSTRKNYIGYEQALKSAIKKYGKNNFMRQNIYEGDWESVDLLESLLIEKHNAIKNPMFYNLKEGGHHGKHNNLETSKKMSKAALGRKDSDETKKKKSESIMGDKNPFFGKRHDERTKTIIKEKRAKQVITKESNHKRSLTLTGLKRVKAICSHCCLIGAQSLLKRYHYNNCQLKDLL